MKKLILRLKHVKHLSFVFICVLCWPAALAAQNGITVSNLSVSAGTVTFDVGWNDTGMPALWSDTVWVFVDYNDAGTMRRLPLLPGATLTATSRPGAGMVLEEKDNNKGVWVAGNARTERRFDATVRLLTATAGLRGICAYVSNYPPVGQYISDTEISFTGTPMYDIVLAHESGATVTRQSGSLFTVPEGYTVLSFIDKTGAPGIIKCLPHSATYTLTASDACEKKFLDVTLTGSQRGWTYQLYDDAGVVVVAASGTGQAIQFKVVPAVGNRTYTAWTADANKIRCTVPVSNTAAVTVSREPAAPIGTGSERCGAGTVTLMASSGGAEIDWYNAPAAAGGALLLRGSNTYTTPGISSTVAYYAEARDATSGCVSSSRTSVLGTANREPNPPGGGTGSERCGAGTVTFHATAPSGCTIDWYDAPTGGATVTGGYGVTSFSPYLTTSTTYYAQSRNTTTGCVSSSRTPVAAIVDMPPVAPAELKPNIATVCQGAKVTLTAAGGSPGSGAVYEWGTLKLANEVPLSPSTTTVGSYVVPVAEPTIYWVRLRGATACTEATAAATTSVGMYPAFSAGAILDDAQMSVEGIFPKVTVRDRASASGHIVEYLWRVSGTGSETIPFNHASFDLNNNVSNNYAAAGIYFFNRYARDLTCNTEWVAAMGTYTLTVESSCAFKKPFVLTTFEEFDPTYRDSHTATLLDARDGKTYKVVKIGGRWIMAQNLNFQKGLTWQAHADSPKVQNPSNGVELIGHFWCPGAQKSKTSTRESCEVWGALYVWETAMMVDGKWTSDAQNDDRWTEPSSYGTNKDSGNAQNHGRSGDGDVRNGRGICPPKWHVPTDAEWGDILNAMESGAKTDHNQKIGFCGSDAALHGKAVCTLAQGATPNDIEPKWEYNAYTAASIDTYELRILPAGLRYYDGSSFSVRNISGDLWSSSAQDPSNAWLREFNYNFANVYRGVSSRSLGLPVRCIRD